MFQASFIFSVSQSWAVNQLSPLRTSAGCVHHQSVSESADETRLQPVNHPCFSSPLGKYFGSEKQRNLGNDGSQSSISSCAWTQTFQEHRFCLTWHDTWEQGAQK